MCPYCGSRSRHRCLTLFLLEDLSDDLEAARLLHFAPEKALEARLRDRLGDSYLSADLRSGAAMVTADMTDLTFDDQSFDMVVASHVLEHISDDRAALSELLRVLRPGGRAILQHPIEYARETYEDAAITSPEARQLAFGQDDHVRVYGRDFADRMRAAGFTVELVRYSECVAAADVERRGLHDLEGTLKADDIYVGTRPA